MSIISRPDTIADQFDDRSSVVRMLAPKGSRQLEQGCAQLGVPIFAVDMEGALDQIEEFVRVGRETGRSHQVTTVNADFLANAINHDDIHAILRGADLSLADGMPIVWASRALGTDLPCRVAGADLVPALASRAARHGYRVLFFGGSNKSAETSARILSNANPGFIVESIEADVGPKGQTNSSTIDEIRAFGADIVCVALGHPKQERWIRAHGAQLGIPVAIGVGGTFDFIAQHKKRAPSWIGRVGFEWLYRLLHEPKRLSRRYVEDFAVYLPAIGHQIVVTGSSKTKSHGPAKVVVEAGAPNVVALSDGPIGRQTVRDLTVTAVRARSENRTPLLVLPTVDQTRKLQALRIDRLFRFVPDAAPLGVLTTNSQINNPAWGEFSA